MKCYTGTSYRCGFKLKEIKENESKRNLCQFLKLPNTGKIYRTSIHNKYRYTYKKNQIVFYKFNTVWELPDPEKKKTDPDTSS